MSKLLEFNYRCFFGSTFIVVFSVLHRGKSTHKNRKNQVYKCASHLFLKTKNPTCSSLIRKHVFFLWKVFWYPIDSLDFLEISVFYEATKKSSTQQVEPTYVVIFHWWDKLFRHRDVLNCIWWFSQFLLFVQFCERHILAFSEPPCQSKTKAMETLPVLTTWIFEKGAAVLFMDENRGAKKHHQTAQFCKMQNQKLQQLLGDGFKHLFNFHPHLGKIPIFSLIFFNWVG